jgi:hypothetical protein
MRRNDIFMFLPILLGLGICTQAPAQEKQPADSVNYFAHSQDTTVVLFEDLFGRWRDGTAGTFGFSPSSSRSELLSVPGSTSKSQSNATFLSGVLGDRRTYQLSAGFANISPDQTRQQYNVTAGYRAVDGLQTSAEVDLTRIQEPVPFNSYKIDCGITYLTDGVLQYQPERFSYYYHFSELLLDRGTTLISILPHYNDTMEDDVSGTPSHEEWGGPISIAIGLWKNSTLKFAGDYSHSASKLTSPANLLNANIGTVATVGDMTSESYSAGLIQRLSDHFMVSVASGWTSAKTGSDYSTNIVGSPSSTISAESKQSYYCVSAGLSMLYLVQPVTIGDLRRSSYNGIYLRTTEWKNQVRFSYMSPAGPLSQSAGIADDFSYGILDHLEIGAGGNYAFARKSNFNPIDGWSYSVGLTLHNLNFGGDELSDHDFFWGRITDPGDYVAGLQWKQEQIVGSLMPKTRVISLQLQLPLIRHMDIGLNLSNTLINSFGTQKINSISAMLRANISSSMRVKFSASRIADDLNAMTNPELYLPAISGEMDLRKFVLDLRVDILL